MKYHKGLSSLLFIISVINSYIYSKNHLYQMANTFLIYTSFFANTNLDNELLLLADYVAVYMCCISYLDIFLQKIFTGFILYEYLRFGSIEYTKNTAFVVAITDSIINTYYSDLDKVYYYTILYSSIAGPVIYTIRYHELIPEKYDIMITSLWHEYIIYFLYECLV
jgi:hypothetical protein